MTLSRDFIRERTEIPLGLGTASHDSHPDLPHLALLVLSAVLEVVCVSLPGYVVARMGFFNADQQKFVANLNMMLFTPCLIFTKLASQLNPGKLSELAIIPVIFAISTAVAWVASQLVARVFRLNRRATNFVTAMGIFGNSNSLPISLVLSLSQTLRGLHWDRIPNDTDDDVAARGILYLLIFQQLGLAVRWSWGYHVLLAPKSAYPEYDDERVEEGSYRDHDDEDEHAETAYNTPALTVSRPESDDEEDSLRKSSRSDLRNNAASSTTLVDLFPHSSPTAELPPTGVCAWASNRCDSMYHSFSPRTQSVLSSVKYWTVRVASGFWDFMNPPLWAMLVAIIVASVPALQDAFMNEDSFIHDSVTTALRSNANVAVPLILVVLGANLARNTQSQDRTDPEEAVIGNKLVVAALISRMLLPTAIMLPILALMAKYVPFSILDDPIFIIVCFLLTGAPSALQLAQICQINGVYEGVMSRVLFQSYVVWILPSTLILVMTALEVVEWAT